MEFLKDFFDFLKCLNFEKKMFLVFEIMGQGHPTFFELEISLDPRN